MKRKILAVLLGAVITGASVGGVVMCSNASGVKEEETDNSNLGRIPVITMKDVKRQERYNKALQKLMEEQP